MIEVSELIGVYHADGGLIGELAYLIGKARGAAHCGLCDVTHRGVRRKREWDDMVAATGVPFRLVHLNERDADVEHASRAHTPCVLARTASGLVLLLGPVDVDRCDGDVGTFAAALRAAAADRGLLLPHLA
ncbi:hypothetical protein [Catellatospora sp. NPDC049609]|uniref:hypothetical protein n=1 Tax=Catellatospora sp. NPDC049609 TaxID=3155505 RepID=UPI00342E2F40